MLSEAAAGGMSAENVQRSLYVVGLSRVENSGVAGEDSLVENYHNGLTGISRDHFWRLAVRKENK